MTVVRSQDLLIQMTQNDAMKESNSVNRVVGAGLSSNRLVILNFDGSTAVADERKVMLNFLILPDAPGLQTLPVMRCS